MLVKQNQVKIVFMQNNTHSQVAALRVAQWRDHVANLLGRAPRGLRDIAVFNNEGLPCVIRVASLVDGKPFPTLYWLVDPELSLRIDRVEAGGLIAQMQKQVDASAALQTKMSADHAAHKLHRTRFLSADERRILSGRGMMAALDQRGIGGIAEPTRIRCLHTWYAAHLVTPNTIGQLLDAHWQAEPL